MHTNRSVCYDTMTLHAAAARTALDVIWRSFVVEERVLAEGERHAELLRFVVEVEHLQDVVQRTHKRQPQMRRTRHPTPMHWTPVPTRPVLVFSKLN